MCATKACYTCVVLTTVGAVWVCVHACVRACVCACVCACVSVSERMFICSYVYT